MFRILDAYDRMPEPRRFLTFFGCFVGASALGDAADLVLGTGGVGYAAAAVSLGIATVVRIAHVHSRRG